MAQSSNPEAPLTVEGGGTAGSPSTHVVSVQGVAGGTALPVSSAAPAGAANAGTVSATTTRVVQATSATGTKSSVNDAATSTTLLAANTSRLGFIIRNDSTADLYVDLSGGTATSTSYSELLYPGDSIYGTEYNGLITGIWASDASGAARVTEFT